MQINVRCVSRKNVHKMCSKFMDHELQLALVDTHRVHRPLADVLVEQTNDVEPVLPTAIDRRPRDDD